LAECLPAGKILGIGGSFGGLSLVAVVSPDLETGAGGFRCLSGEREECNRRNKKMMTDYSMG
jgi:hypothetical protein